MDPAAERTRARSDRPPAHAVARAALRRRPAAAGGDRRPPRHDGHLRPRPPRARRPDRHALDRPGVTEAVRQQWRASFGLDRPLGEQYVRWLANAPRGDLGYSFSFRRPVARRHRRRAAAHAAARRARAHAQLRARASSSPCCSPSGRAARVIAGSAAVLLVLYSVPGLLARARHAARLRLLAADPAAERDRRSGDARLHVARRARCSTGSGISCCRSRRSRCSPPRRSRAISAARCSR